MAYYEYIHECNPGEHFRYYGTTLGCGCCSEREGIKLEDVKQYISGLEAELKYAKEVLADIEQNGETNYDE